MGFVLHRLTERRIWERLLRERFSVGKAGCSHRTMVTGSGKKAANRTPFRWVNTALGNIKTALAGTYHHVSAKHAQRYLTSFAWRLYGASGVKL